MMTLNQIPKSKYFPIFLIASQKFSFWNFLKLINITPLTKSIMMAHFSESTNNEKTNKKLLDRHSNFSRNKRQTVKNRFCGFKAVQDLKFRP